MKWGTGYPADLAPMYRNLLETKIYIILCRCRLFVVASSGRPNIREFHGRAMKKRLHNHGTRSQIYLFFLLTFHIEYK